MPHKISPLLFTAVFFGLLISPTAAQTNLLQNPGFETGTSHPDGWITFPAFPPGTTYDWDGAVSNSGAYSVSIENFSSTLAMWRQVVPVTEGTVYTFAGYLNVSNVPPSGHCKLELLFRGPGGELVEVCEILRHFGNIDWIYDLPHESCYRAPAGAVSVEVNLVLNGKGKVWFDDILFGPAPLGSVSGTVINGAGPVEGALVEVWGTDLSALTDDTGQYVITGIPVASPRYILMASKNGYRTRPAGCVDVVEGGVTDVDFVLRPGADPADTDIQVKCGRIAWMGDTIPNTVDPLAVIDPVLYPPEAQVFLADHAYIDCSHPVVQQAAAEILDSVDPGDRDNTLAVSHAAYLWIARNAEWDGVYHSANYVDPTSGAWQTISGEGWCFGNSFAEWLYKPSESIGQNRGICIEHGRLGAGVLRALGIPARPIQPYGTQFWVQLPSGSGWWATMSTSGGRTAYKTNGDEWLCYASTPDSGIYGFPVDAGGWIHSDWDTQRKCLWRERHPWREQYENTAAGLAQALADLNTFALTGEAPNSPTPPPGPKYEIDYSDFTLDLRNMGDQRKLEARFPLPVETGAVLDMDEYAFWTDHPECVTTTWVETIVNPPVAEENKWFNIEFDLTSMLPPREVDMVDLEANGSDEPIVLSAGDRLRVTLSVDPGPLSGTIVDWWVRAETPLGWSTLVTSGKWEPGLQRSYVGGLVSITNHPILDTTALPPGEYTFCFAVDYPDGAAEGTCFDKVEVTIT